MIGECLPRLTAIGIEYGDAVELRRIAMTLQRWHELECGDGRGVIERDEETSKIYWVVDHGYTTSNKPNMIRRWPIPDRKTGALKRLDAIMVKYPDLQAYVQGDPRGAALWILRPQDIIPGADMNSYYSRGVAVYK